MVTTGGTEKMLSEKASYLADTFCYDVTIISCTQNVKESNTFPLSQNVKQINLAIPYYRQYHYHYPKRLLVKRKTNHVLKEQLTKTIQKIDPDVIIGVARFAADIVTTIKCRAKRIIECHEARPFIMADVEGNRPLASRIYTNLILKKRYFQIIERHANVVVTLTKGDSHLWQKAHHVEVIPNFSTMPVTKMADYNNKRVIAVGRLSAEKGYDRLLKIWKRISPQHPEWSLEFFGDGKLHNMLTNMIRELQLQNVNINPPTPHISEEYAKSSISVLTSHFEGFSLVLLEASRHGLPCIAFDCPFGPASVIKDGVCGYIIKDDDIEQYAQKLSLMMDQEDIWKSLSRGAVERAADFSVDIVMKHWQQLLEDLVHTKSI
jgi:glycosyltransferase involved in cell wall biosynthesis